jgi:hypothetical protein
LSTGYDELRVAFPVTRRDYVRVTRLLLRRQILKLGLLLAAFAVVATLLSQLLFGPHDGFWPWLGVGLGVVLLFVLILRELVVARVRTAVRKRPELYPEGRREMSFGPEGFRIEVGNSRSRSRWTRVDAIVLGRRYLLLKLSPASGLPIPRTALGDREEEARFVGTLRRWLDEARAGAGATPIPGEPSDLVRNPEALHLRFRNDIRDYVTFIRYVQWERRPHKWILPILAAVILGLSVCGGTLLLLIGDSAAEVAPFGGFAVFAVVAGTFSVWGGAITTMTARRRVRRRPRQYSLEEKELHVGPDGLYGHTDQGEASLPWSQITDVIHHRARTFLMVGEHSAFIVPDQVFDDPAAATAFRSQVVEWGERAARRREDASAPVRKPEGDNPFEAPNQH